MTIGKFIYGVFYCICAHYCIITKPFSYDMKYRINEYKKKDFLHSTFISSLYKNTYTKRYVLVNNNFTFNEFRKRKWINVIGIYLRLEKINVKSRQKNRLLYITIELIKSTLNSICFKNGIRTSKNTFKIDSYAVRSTTLVSSLIKFINFRKFINSKFLLVVNMKYTVKNISITPIKFHYFLVVSQVCIKRQKIRCLKYRLYNRIKSSVVNLGFLSKPYCL
jgi:hypothetical protein